MNKKDREEFIAFLAACTDRQCLGVYEKEKIAGRGDYAKLAADACRERGNYDYGDDNEPSEEDIERQRLFEKYGDERLR